MKPLLLSLNALILQQGAVVCFPKKTLSTKLALLVRKEQARKSGNHSVCSDFVDQGQSDGLRPCVCKCVRVLLELATRSQPTGTACKTYQEPSSTVLILMSWIRRCSVMALCTLPKTLIYSQYLEYLPCYISYIRVYPKGAWHSVHNDYFKKLTFAKLTVAPLP